MEHDPRWKVNASTYRNHRCRCDGCKQANTDAHRDYYHRRAAANPDYHWVKGKWMKRVTS